MVLIVNQCETPMPPHTYPAPFKRLLVSVYDGLLILAILFIATALTLPFTSGKAVSGNNILMPIYLLSVTYLFYGWFWTHGGQTLGMRAWKMQLISLVPFDPGSSFKSNAVSWKQSLIRFLTALPAWSVFLLGFLLWVLPAKIEISEWLKIVPIWVLLLSGFVWVLLDNRPGNWRDKLSGTEIVLIEKSDS